MNNPNTEPRFDGDTDRTDLAARTLPQRLKDRLDRLRETGGLTWSALSWTIDVDGKRARRWRRKGGK